MQPLNIWNLAFSVTNQCNLRCKHCYATSGEAIKGELTLSQIEERLIKPAAEVGTKFVTFTGGEPFTREDFIEIIQMTHQAGIGVSIATNGLLLNADLVDRLKNVHIDRVQISMEGSTADLNDQIRGGGVYATLTEHVIPNLLQMGIFVAISFTPMLRNMFDITGMADLCLKLGVPSLSIRRYSDTGRAKANSLAMPVKGGREIADTVYQLKEKYQGKLTISSGDPICILSHPSIDKYLDGHYLSGCTAGITSIAVDSIGNIKPCTRANYIVGNVLTDELTAVWSENEILIKLRNRDNLLGKCGKCKYRMLCGGCRVTAFNKYHNLLEEDDQCWMR